jgi:hypothetical protein
VSVVAWWLLRHPSARSEGQVFPLFLALFPTRVGRLILLELGMVRGWYALHCVLFRSSRVPDSPLCKNHSRPLTVIFLRDTMIWVPDLQQLIHAIISAGSYSIRSSSSLVPSTPVGPTAATSRTPTKSRCVCQEPTHRTTQAPGSHITRQLHAYHCVEIAYINNTHSYAQH